MAKNNYI